MFTEKKNKLSLSVPSTNEEVKLTMNTYHATESSCSWMINGILGKVKKGETVVLGKASELKGLTITFIGKSNNPSGGKIKVEYIFTSPNGNTLAYTFPKDYEGTPAFDTEDGQPLLMFEVKFI